jgi:hypothetical protein
MEPSLELKSAAELATARTANPFAPTLAAGAAHQPAGTVRKEFGGGPTATDKAVAKDITDAGRNQLGSLAGATQNLAVTVDLVAVVRRHASKIATKDELIALTAAAKEFEAEARIQAEHSPVIQAEKIRQATAVYASSPTAKNLEALRHLKTLDLRDHALVQQHAIQRKQKIFREKIAPLEAPIYRRFATELDTDVETIQANHEAVYREFGCAAPAHPLAEQLRAIAKLHRAMAGHRDVGAGMGDTMPELLTALLAK